MRDLLQDSLLLWQQDGGNRLPPFDRTFTRHEQTTREVEFDRLLRRVETELSNFPCTRAERRAARRRASSSFEDFARACLDLDDSHLEVLREGFGTVAMQLARQAREFDPSISAADIFQAGRNAWTACALEHMMCGEMQLTPAIFAYSMLYPYTDNYMDDPAISSCDKLAFSVRFRRRLEGKAVSPEQDREATIWRLVELIEQQWARDEWPKVYDSLLGIHRAQENSIRLLRFGEDRARADVAKLSFEKGGASVLADAYLAAGPILPDEAEFAFNWGVLLQLGDDLQDLQEDLRGGILTVFTQAAAAAPAGRTAGGTLDELTRRTLHFGSRAMAHIDHMPSSRSEHQSVALRHKPLKELIRMSCSLLLIWSAGRSATHYTADFLAELEMHSPFRLASLGEKRRKLARWTVPLTRLFESFLEDDEEGAAPLALASALMPRF